jgi:molybdenum cofactor cytidylyltransferase
MIWAMILAAGESRRMREAKLLLPFRGKTIIETIIESVIRSKVDKILVVLGSDIEKIEEKIKSFPLEFAFNPDYRSGMLSSIQRGFKALPKDAQAVLIILGDQPSVSSKVINKIIAAYKKTGKGIVLPVYKKERGHPVLIDTKYRQEVAKLSPKIGLRKLVYNRPDDILEVKVETSSVLRDIDDAEDYRKELEKTIRNR